MRAWAPDGPKPTLPPLPVVSTVPAQHRSLPDGGQQPREVGLQVVGNEESQDEIYEVIRELPTENF